MKRIRLHSTPNPAVKVSKVIRDREGRELQIRLNNDEKRGTINKADDNTELFSVSGPSIAAIQKILKNQLRTMGVEFDSELRTERNGDE